MLHKGRVVACLLSVAISWPAFGVIPELAFEGPYSSRQARENKSAEPSRAGTAVGVSGNPIAMAVLAALALFAVQAPDLPHFWNDNSQAAVEAPPVVIDQTALAGLLGDLINRERELSEAIEEGNSEKIEEVIREIPPELRSFVEGKVRAGELQPSEVATYTESLLKGKIVQIGRRLAPQEAREVDQALQSQNPAAIASAKKAYQRAITQIYLDTF